MFDRIREQVRNLDLAYRNDRPRAQRTLFGDVPESVWTCHHSLVSKALELAAESDLMLRLPEDAPTMTPPHAATEQTAQWSEVGSQGASGLWKAVELANRYDPQARYVSPAERVALVHVAAIEHYRCGRHGVARAILDHPFARLPPEVIPIEPLVFLSRLAQAWVGKPRSWPMAAQALRDTVRRELTLAEPRVSKSSLLGMAATADSLEALHAAAVEGRPEAWDKVAESLRDAGTLLRPYGSPGVDIIIGSLQRSLLALRRLSVWEWSRVHLPAGNSGAESWTRRKAADKPFFFPSQVAVVSSDLATSSTFVSMPTGAGKTTVAEVYLLQHFLMAPARKHFFIVPTRALATEKFQELEEAFDWVGGPRLCKLTSDVSASSVEAVRENDIIILTPEKFDVLVRRKFYADKDPQPVGGVVMDEFHMIRNNVRGIKLQLTLYRFLSRYSSPVLYITAILSNADARALQSWTGAANLVVHRWRPVLLRTGTVDLSRRHEPMDIDFDDGTLRYVGTLDIHASKTIEPEVHVITELLKDGPVLRFGLRAKNDFGPPIPVEDGIKLLQAGLEIETSDALKAHVADLQRLVGEASPLVDLLAKGIGTHWGDLPQRARQIVEGAARDGSARLVLATSTLADGVNMPFRSVWFPRAETGLRPLGESTYLNTAGRAGRPYQHVEGQVVLAYHTKGAHKVSYKAVMRYVDLDADKLPALQGAIALLARHYSTEKLDETDAISEREKEAQFHVLCAMILAALTERMTSRVRESPELIRCFVVRSDLGTTGIPRLLTSVEAELLRHGCIVVDADGRATLTPWGRIVYGTGLAPESCSRLRRRLAEITKDCGSLSWHPRLATNQERGKPIGQLIEMAVLPVEFPRERDAGDQYLIRGWMTGQHLGRVSQESHEQAGIRYLATLSRAEGHVALWFSWLFDALALIAEYEELPPKRIKDLRALSRASTHGDFRPWVQQVLKRDFHRMLLRDDVISIREAAVGPVGLRQLVPTREGLMRFMTERNVQTRAPPEEVAEELGRVMREIPLSPWRTKANG
jgi:hypothetical protein